MEGILSMAPTSHISVVPGFAKTTVTPSETRARIIVSAEVGPESMLRPCLRNG